MDNLKAGDILIRISDNSKWKFLHYGERADQHQFSSTLAENEDILHFLDDTSKVHVKAWDEKANGWIEDSHEEFPTTDFKRA